MEPLAPYAVGYRSGFGFHSRANFCASAICSAVICFAEML